MRCWMVSAFMNTEAWQEAIAEGDLVTANVPFGKMAKFWSLIICQADGEQRRER